jgi:alkyldihydroxyacetonephosphate synthase
LVELQSEREPGLRPSAVVWPETVEDVIRLIELGRSVGFKLVPFGAGSGVCGAIAPDAETVVVDVKRFADRRVLPGPVLDVGAGALGITLEEELLGEGYTIGHYPSSILCSTVGGWVAARGAGQCSGRYGKIEDMVTSVEAVLGTGEVVRAARRANGPDLLPLLVGSEGILGIITRVGLRMHAAPSERRFASFAFPSMAAGIGAVRELFQHGLRPAVVRLYDPLDTFLLADHDHEKTARGHGDRERARKSIDLGARGRVLRSVLNAPRVMARALALAESTLMRRAALVLVHEGSDATLAEETQRAQAICQRAGGEGLGEGPARAWYRRRYSVSYRQSPVFRGGAFSDTMEVAAPWSRIPDVYEGVRRALGEHVLVMAHLSHAYPDGASLYFTFAGTAHGGDGAVAVYDRAWRVALAAAIEAGAALSHHHGVGRSKAPRLGADLGGGVAIVRALKQAWDPDQLLNPGALLPPPEPEHRRDLVGMGVGSPRAEPAFDRESGLASLPGSITLAAAEAFVRSAGHTLGVSEGALTTDGHHSLDVWIGRGSPGLPDRYADPAYAPIAGFTAVIAERRVVVPAAPRRATGPDLSALLAGAAGRFGRVEHVTLVATPTGVTRLGPLPFDGPRDPGVSESEERALGTLEQSLARISASSSGR